MSAKPWVIVPLVLPVNGKDYEIQPANYDDGMTLMKMTDAGDNADEDTTVLFKLCMGSTWDEMHADKVPYNVMFRAGVAALQFQTALVVAGFDSDTAVTAGEQAWESGIDPEALAAALEAQAANQAPAKKTAAKKQTASSRSTNTDAARKTPSRASGSGTRSPKATPRTARKPAAKTAPRGPRSSPSGS